MSDPVLLIGVTADGIAAFILFAFFERYREIRGRLLPLCVLTLVHALLFPLMMVCDSLHARLFAENILGCIHLFSTPVLLFFIIIYSIVLANRSRMNRPLAISAVIFTVNLLVQAVCAFLAWGHSQGG